MTEPQFVEEQVTVPLKNRPGNFVVGILTSPVNVNPAREARVMVVSHGLLGHKNYCYQKLLCHRLAEVRQIHTFRFDFRNCGDSSDIVIPGVDPKVVNPRTLEEDIDDLDAVVFDYLIGQKNFSLAGIIGHSRGSVSVIQWVIKRQASHQLQVPNIINCSGRYFGKGLQERVDQIYEKLGRYDGYYDKGYRRGAYPDIFIPAAETANLSSVDTTATLKNLSPETFMLSITGLTDTIVPVSDVAQFANDLKSRHHLELIPEADHNFYGPPKPGSDGKKSNYNPIVVDIITEWMSPAAESARFMDIHKYAGTVSRWKAVDGVSNFRDFGGFRTTFPGQVLRAGLLFRCANLAYIEEKGIKAVNALGIKTVFDLRSRGERERAGVAEIPGVDVQWAPVFAEQDTSPEALAKRYEHFFDPVQGFENAYSEILGKGGPSYRRIMLHLRDRPADGILIHCTAGKDRTGVICALILLLMDVDHYTIAREYEMTTHGLRLEIPRIMEAIENSKDVYKNPEGMLNMLSSKYENMIGSISMINRQFGGAVNYLKTHCELTDEDLDIIKRNLSAPTEYRLHSAL